MARENRLSVTVTRDMRIALCILSERSGLAPTTQAMVLLRQALDRTMQSTAFRDAVRGEGGRTVADWQDERYVTAAMLAAQEADNAKEAGE